MMEGRIIQYNRIDLNRVIISLVQRNSCLNGRFGFVLMRGLEDLRGLRCNLWRDEKYSSLCVPRVFVVRRYDIYSMVWEGMAWEGRGRGRGREREKNQKPNLNIRSKYLLIQTQTQTPNSTFQSINLSFFYSQIHITTNTEKQLVFHDT